MKKEKSVKISKLGKVGLVVAVSASLAIPTFTTASAASKFETAKSASEAGGMAALRGQCRKEGQLNIIATPGDWANYQEIFDGYTAKYGVKIDSQNPEGSSQDEINAADAQKGTKRSPDVFDIGASTAAKYLTTHFAPYKVQNWDKIPSNLKDPNGYVTNNYTGVMTIGYDGTLPEIKSLNDLTKAAYKGKVALNGDPNGSNAGLSGVFMAALENGGSFDNVKPGVDYFKKLKDAGTFINVNPTAATIASGQTPVVFDWSYNNKTVQSKFAAIGKSWKIFSPKSAVGGYYNAAISAWAPHPACARLWMEYLYTTAGQNAWAKGGASPVLWAQLLKTNLASVEGKATIGTGRVSAASPSTAQAVKAREYLATAWAAAVGAK